jgi:hypothetical protein
MGGVKMSHPVTLEEKLVDASLNPDDWDQGAVLAMAALMIGGELHKLRAAVDRQSIWLAQLVKTERAENALHGEANECRADLEDGVHRIAATLEISVGGER